MSIEKDIWAFISLKPSCMKISTETLNILKNFSTINSSLVVKQGNTIRTISPAKNILAKFECPESFDNDFAVYDLNKFLGGVITF